MPVSKAKVEASAGHPDENGFHTVTIRVYGEHSSFDAPVLPLSIGSAWIPKANTDVAVMFGSSDKPFVVGPWYAIDRVEKGEVDIPDYEPGEVVIGNEEGHIRIDNNGAVTTSDTFSDFGDEEAQDATAAMLAGGTGISLTYDDAGDTLTIDSHPRYTDEEAEDAINALLTAGTHLTSTYDDAGNTLTLDVSDDWVDITGDTMSGALTVDGADLTVTGPDDGAGSVTFQKGADTTTTGTPSMTVDVDGVLNEQTNRVATRLWATSSNIAVGDLAGVTGEGSGGGLDADLLDGYDSSDIMRSKNIAVITSTDTATNINATTWTQIPWNKQLDVDGGYTHDPANSPEQITFDNGGTYRVKAGLTYDANGNARINPGIKFAINGTRRDALGLTGYVRSASGHGEGSNYLEETITVNAGDTLTVETYQYGNSGTVTLRNSESELIIEQVSHSVAVAGDTDTVDGYHAADFLLASGDTLGGNLNLGGNTIDGIQTESQSNPALRASLDSGSSTEHWVDMARLNNASGDDYRWHVNLNNDEPLLIYNDTTNTRMLEVRKSGVEVSGPLGRDGCLSGHLSTTQTGAEAGVTVNTFQNISINDGPYTKDNSSQVTINKAGKYRISYTCQFHRTGSGARNVMANEIQVNGAGQTDKTYSSCYIRTDGNGDENSNSASPILSLASGDSLTLRAWEVRGGETGNDIEHAHIDIEYLG